MSMTGDYPNRSDLRGGTRANYTGQTYGTATAQEQSQQAVPPGPPPTDAAGGGLMLERPMPGAAGFARPTERPDEPITAGADFGPGPSALQAGIRPRVMNFDETLLRLQALNRAYPNEGLTKFLARYSNRLV